MTISDDQPLKGMRICVLVNNDTYRDSRVKKECAALAEAGAHVTVVGFGDTYPGDTNVLPYRLMLVRPSEFPAWYVNLGRETVFYPLRVAVNLSLRPYFRRTFASVHSSIIKAVQGEGFDIIHANDFDMLETGALLAKRNKAKLVYDSHEIFLAPGRWKFKPSVQEKFERDEERLFQRVDKLVTVNPKIGEYLSARYNSTVETVSIYNGSTARVADATPTHMPMRVLFLGIFQKFFNFPELISQMERFRGKLELTLQGYGGEESAIEEAIKANDLQDFIRVVPPVDTFSIVSSSKSYDLGIINTEVDNLNLEMCSPNKFFDYLSAGLGVIASDQQTFIASVIKDTGCGFSYNQQRPEDLFIALDYLIAHPDEVSEMKRKALATASRFSWDVQKAKLVELYSSLR